MIEKKFQCLLRCCCCNEPLALRDENGSDFSSTFISLAGRQFCHVCSVVVLGIDLMPRFLLIAAGLTDNEGMGAN